MNVSSMASSDTMMVAVRPMGRFLCEKTKSIPLAEWFFWELKIRTEETDKMQETAARNRNMKTLCERSWVLNSTIKRYYGAVLEVSRGCPFLCEFCDIRILPDNNRPHNKSADLIVAEMDHLCSLGVRQVLFACDNFIGG